MIAKFTQARDAANSEGQASLPLDDVSECTIDDFLDQCAGWHTEPDSRDQAPTAAPLRGEPGMRGEPGQPPCPATPTSGRVLKEMRSDVSSLSLDSDGFPNIACLQQAHEAVQAKKKPNAGAANRLIHTY